MNYITNQKVSFLVQGVLRKKQQIQTIITIFTVHPEYRRNKKLLAYVKHGERTKPPSMKIERKSVKLRLQPHKSEGLNLVDHLSYRINFVCKQPVVSFFPYFPDSSKPYNL